MKAELNVTNTFIFNTVNSKGGEHSTMGLHQELWILPAQRYRAESSLHLFRQVVLSKLKGRRGLASGQCCYLMAHLKLDSYVIVVMPYWKKKKSFILLCCKYTEHPLLTSLPSSSNKEQQSGVNTSSFNASVQKASVNFVVHYHTPAHFSSCVWRYFFTKLIAITLLN